MSSRQLDKKTTYFSDKLTTIFNETLTDDVLVIIPCYNESKNIENCVNLLKTTIDIDFIVINDCSTDNSLEIIKKNGWNYIDNKKNLGLSGSFAVGAKYANENGYKYVVQYDGDGQHNPADIAQMIMFAKKGYDIVVTSRYYNVNNISLSKKIAHKILNTLFKIKTHQKITDATCGLRIYNWLFINEFINNDKMEVEPSSIAYLIRRDKLKIKEIPTTVFNRQHGSSSFDRKSHIFKYMNRQIFRLIFTSANKGVRHE